MQLDDSSEKFLLRNDSFAKVILLLQNCDLQLLQCDICQKCGNRVT